MWCAPGNAGTATERLLKTSNIVENVNIAAEDLPNLLKFAREQQIDLTVVGPELPLSRGVADLFAAEELPLFGPTQRAARLESSKVFAKEFMQRCGVPTAR